MQRMRFVEAKRAWSSCRTVTGLQGRIRILPGPNPPFWLEETLMRSQLFRIIITASALASALGASNAFANELTAFAVMPANTFAVGSTSGQFAGSGAGGNALPLVNKQPVQGISAVLAGPTDDTFYVMPDNGFGAKTNSADALLRVYAIKPDFTVWTKRGRRGSGTISPANF